MKAFKCYSDPQHGWVAVKRKLLIELGILDKITWHSYQRGQTVYLEEDKDAGTFIEAYMNRFGSKPALKESWTERTPIRSYEHFRKD